MIVALVQLEANPSRVRPPRPSLPRTDTQKIGLNTAGRGPSPRAVIARSVCVPGWSGGEECGILQVSGCAELPVKLPSSERDSTKVPFCLLWVNRARETFIIDRVYGSKQGNILYTRLRVATSKLNAHLYQLQLADSPSCSCGYQFETTEHFILHCKLHDNPRTTLFNELSNVIGTNFASLTRPLQIDIILNGDGLTGISGREVAYCVQKFIFSSHRFR